METNNEKFPYLRTGYTLLTSQTKRWSEEAMRVNNEIEAKMIFKNFTEEDFGTSRKKIAVCETKEDAKEIVNRCNGYSALQSENERLRDALQAVLAYEKSGADKGEPRIGNGILNTIHLALNQSTVKTETK